jgi:predicted ATP-dependent endonuclease of OLD family
VIGFAGANASGKTTILQAIRFAFWFMQKSFSAIQEREAIPSHPFVTTSKLPSKFHLIFTQKNSENKYIDYEYLLTVNQEQVLKEDVYYYPNNSQEQELVYERKEKQVKFGKNIHILGEDVISALPITSSIISFLAQFPSQNIAQNLQKYPNGSNVNRMGLMQFEFKPSIIKNFADDSILEEQLINILRIADVGIESVNLKPIPENEKKVIEHLINTSDSESRLFSQQRTREMLSEVKFKHKVDDILVEFSDIYESAGTLKLIVLLEKIQLAFNQGYSLIFDEIELQLHQNLIAYLIGLFENPNQNIEGGQLLFSFHNTALMEILQPNQLWFTEKNDQGQTEIFSAADFTDIKDIQQRNLE